MIKILKVKKVLPGRTFDSKDSLGNPRKVLVASFVLSDGINSMVAEAYGDVATACANKNLQEGDLCSVKISTEARSWNDQQGQERWETRVAIQGIDVLAKNSF